MPKLQIAILESAEKAQSSQSSGVGADREGKMTNPPSYVVYVVLVKPTKDSVFDPCWGEWADSQNGIYAKGFARKQDAQRECKVWRVRYGKHNAYVQQYGPIS